MTPPFKKISKIIKPPSLESEIEEKVFCIGIQRNGTTSTGDFCEQQLGMVRCGNKLSRELEWSRLWLNGKLEEVFADPNFKAGQMFDDGPWWFPGVYQQLFEIFPKSKFIIFTREPEEWFRSLQSHSKGVSPGYTDVHAKVYGRDIDYEALKIKHGGALDPLHKNGLDLTNYAAHYIDHYKRHIADVLAFFNKNGPDRLFVAKLNDPQKFRAMARFLGYPDHNYPEIRSSAIMSLGADAKTATVTKLKSLHPDFVCAGVQKSGTTWLYNQLVSNKMISIPAKECNILTDKNHVARYAKFYANSTEDNILGDVSPFYATQPYAAKRLMKTNPKCKVILLLRDPVARAFSQYRMATKAGRIAAETSFWSAFENNLQFMQRRGCYVDLINEYIQAGLTREALLLLPFEWINEQPQTLMDKVNNFLGMEGNDDASLLKKTFAASTRNAAPSIEDARRIRAFYAKKNEGLRSHLWWSPDWLD